MRELLKRLVSRTRKVVKLALLGGVVALAGCDEWEQCITELPEEPQPLEVCGAATEPGYPKYVDASDEYDPYNACYACSELGECNPGVPEHLYYQLDYRTVRRVCNHFQEENNWGGIICFAVRWNHTCCGALDAAECDFATEDASPPDDGNEWS